MSETLDLYMVDTSASLLHRLQSSADEESWRRLVGLYDPWLRDWLRRHYDLQQTDIDDLVQETFAVVVRELPGFRHNGRRGAFRGWLRAILVNRLRDFWHARDARPAAPGTSDFLDRLRQLEDPDSGLRRIWDQEHDRYIIGRLLQTIEPQFQPATWRAFVMLVLENRPPQAVASELAMTVNAVFIAKSRVLRRLREESDGLLE